MGMKRKTVSGLVGSMIAAISSLTLIAGMAAAPATAMDLELEVVSASGGHPQERGGISVRLVDIPSDAQEDPRARSYIVDRLPPGTTIERRIEVENTTPETQTVRIYPGAATIEEGSFQWGEDPSKNELTSWISLEQDEVELQPGEAEMVMTTIDVPEDAPEAEQYAVIWAEMRGETNEETNVIQASRAGVRVYLSVGPGNGKPADFEIAAVTASRSTEGSPQVVASVTNTGGRAVDVTGELSLSGGPGGTSAGPFELTQPTSLKPGGQGEVVFTLDPGIPNGPWEADLMLESGLVNHESSANLTFPEEGEAAPAEAETAVPWGIIITAGALLLAAAAAALVLRRRRAKGS